MTKTATSPDDWAARTEAAILDHALPLIPDMGWTRPMVHRAAAEAGLDAAESDLLLPEGPRDLAALLSRRHDEVASNALGALDIGALKIRERIARGVEARIDAAMSDEAAVRRLCGFLVLPANLALGARLNWATANLIWRWAGDTATDENHYSKRAILSGLLASTLAVRLASGQAAAADHLARGIEAVMAYEKFKGRFRGKSWASTLAGSLGAARYGRRQQPVNPA